MESKLATEDDYRKVARQVRENEPELRLGSTDFIASMREILNENGMITHSQLQRGEGEGVILVTSR